jgi:hypothetical protein
MMSPSQKKGFSSVPVRCLWGHLCTLSSIDKETNNVSLFNVIEQFNFSNDVFQEYAKTKKPVIIGLNHEIVLVWMRTLDIDGINEELNFDFMLKLVDPTGEVIQQIYSTGNFPKEAKRNRFRINTNGIAVTMPGNYRYVIEVKKEGGDQFEAINEIPLEIKMGIAQR